MNENIYNYDLIANFHILSVCVFFFSFKQN